MDHSVKYNFFMSQLTHIEDLKDTEKTKISVVYHEGLKSACILRICKNRDLSSVCNALRHIRNLNTVVVHDFVYENGDTYILEENVDGNTVSEIIEDKGPMSEQRTAKIMIDICNALEELHQETPPVVHNDINPSNIKIKDDGTVKLFDFDISRTYKKGQSKNTVLFGTEEYAAPEHFGYGQSEPRTDIYCLGVTMHKMLTGQGLSSEHRMTYNGKLKNIIGKCLEFDPKNRYNSVHMLKKDLEKFLSRKKGRRFAMLSSLLALIIICSIAILWGTLKSRSTKGMEHATVSETTNNNTNDTPDNDTAPSDTDDADTPDTTESVEEVFNDTQATAQRLSLNKNLTGSFTENTTAWYKFTSRKSNSVYRIAVYPKDVPGNTLMPFQCVAVYDTAGIKLDEFNVWSDNEYDFIDLSLEPGTEYFIKLSLGERFDGGNYELCVSELRCDAGINKDTATSLALGEQNISTIDSTLSDWHVFCVPKAGEYTYTIHNINVGCDIYFSKQQPGSAGEGMCVENEDNYSGRIRNVQEGDLVYFEIYPYGENPTANGDYIIVIEEADK